MDNLEHMIKEIGVDRIFEIAMENRWKAENKVVPWIYNQALRIFTTRMRRRALGGFFDLTVDITDEDVILNNKSFEFICEEFARYLRELLDYEVDIKFWEDSENCKDKCTFKISWDLRPVKKCIVGHTSESPNIEE